MADSPLDVWKRKLEALRVAEATASTAAQKFELAEQIQEAEAKIAELERGNVVSSVLPAQSKTHRCRLMIDLNREFDSGELANSDMTSILREHEAKISRLRTTDAYTFETMRAALHDADEKFAAGDAEYPISTGRLLKINAAAIVCTALCASLKPGRALHELVLAVAKSILREELPEIDRKLNQSNSFDLYEAALRLNAVAVHNFLEVLLLTAEKK